MLRYYQVLGLHKNASEQDIKSAYRKLAKKYHPDVNKSEAATSRFLEISEAYKYLMSNYDLPAPEPDEEEVERQKAREWAREKSRQYVEQVYAFRLYTAKITRRFAIFTVLFQLLPLADSLLPKQQIMAEITSITRHQLRFNNGIEDVVHTAYYNVTIEGGLPEYPTSDTATFYQTALLDKIVAVDLQLTETLTITNLSTFFNAFRVLFPLVLLITLIIFSVHDLHMNKVTWGILLFFALLVELGYFLVG